MHFLGIDQSDCKLVFLSKNSWVCSLKLSALTDKHYTRQFFVPNEFNTTRAREIPPCLQQKNPYLALHDKFTVVNNELLFEDIVIQDGGRC